MTNKKDFYSLNENTDHLISELIDNRQKYGLNVYKGPLDSTFIDSGIIARGSIEAGIKISEICLGGLGKVEINPYNFSSRINWNINVRSANPVLACLGCQYAGWSLSHESFFSLGSGPARSLANREDIFKEIDYKDDYKKTAIILEVDKEPPIEVVKKISKDCNISPSNLFFILTPTTSMAGNIQIVARVLEVAIHKCHELKFPLERIIDGMGTCPIPPIAKDMITGMGRTNDSIIYGGTVYLSVNGPVKEIINLCKNLPSNNSKDYGKPFKDIFSEYKGDFYKIDGSLFSPARVIINSLETGETFSSGEINKSLVEESFF